MILFEDEHLLAVNKPPGLNTHAPSPHAGEGLYEWLRNSLPGRAQLAIIHRLDKETSGVIVFGKSPAANRSLTQQFERRTARKIYFLLTDRRGAVARFTEKSWLKRAGARQINQAAGAKGEEAVTEFTLTGPAPDSDAGRSGCWLWEARPLTGRTHQIRAQAAARGTPVLGDTLYGGTQARRVFLHAAQLTLRHPATGKEISFHAPPDFSADPHCSLRAAIIPPSETDAYRLVNGAADGWPGLKVDRFGDYLLALSLEPLTRAQCGCVEELRERHSLRGIYHKILRRQAGQRATEESSPELLSGEAAPAEIVARENNLRFAIRFQEGYSVGLFLDQRENRRRLLTGYVAPGFSLGKPAEVLNVFAYTCGFSVAAAGGARTVSLDLSKKYLDWGRRNFVLNGLDPEAHDFIFGDAFAWFRRLAKRGRLFDLIVLDPPTFSRSREHGDFQVARDYRHLVTAALPLLRANGVLLACANAAAFSPDDFLEKVTTAVSHSGRRILQEHYAPQPPDFPVHRDEPAYLKTVWLRIVS